MGICMLIFGFCTIARNFQETAMLKNDGQPISTSTHLSIQENCLRKINEFFGQDRIFSFSQTECHCSNELLTNVLSTKWGW